MINKLLLSAAIVLSGATTVEAAQRSRRKWRNSWLHSVMQACVQSPKMRLVRMSISSPTTSWRDAVQASVVRASQSSISFHRFDRLA